MTTKPRGFGSAKKPPVEKPSAAPAATASAVAAATTPTPSSVPAVKPGILDRVDLGEFEKKAIAEARAANQIRAVAKELVERDPDQPRQIFEPEAMAELQAAIASIGQLQPILVRSLPNGRFKIIAGERRWRAICEIPDLPTIDVVVRDDVDDTTTLVIQITENESRESTTPMETALAYQRLKNKVGDARGAAALLGVNEGHFSSIMSLLKASDRIKDLATTGKVRDITTLSNLERLNRVNEAEANKLVEAITTGEIKAGGVRKVVKETLAGAKGTPPTKNKKAVKLTSTEHEWNKDDSGKAVLIVTTAQGRHEIHLGVKFSTLIEELKAGGTSL